MSEVTANTTGAAGKPPIVWIIGLPNAGKTTVARELKRRLDATGRTAAILDGDGMRVVLEMENSHYDMKNRTANALRIGRLARMLREQGISVVVAANTVIWEVQEEHRKNLEGYFEVYLYCDEATRRLRDGDKRLYHRFDRGEVSQVLGLDLPTEEPRTPELRIDVSHGKATAEEAAEAIFCAVTQPPR